MRRFAYARLGGWAGIRHPAWLVIWLLASLLAPAPLLAAPAEAKVSRVDVRIDMSGGYLGGETMAQLESALRDCAEMAIIEQLDGDLDYILQHQDVVAQTLADVFTSVLAKRGFTLEELAVDPAGTTLVTVKLHLAEELVNDFSVRFFLLGNTPAIDEVVSADEEAVAGELVSKMARTPYGDTRWLTRMVSETAEQRLAQLPGYEDFEHVTVVQPGPTTKVTVTFSPRAEAQVVKSYRLNIYSRTIPQLLLKPVEDRLAHYLQSFNGAPLSFIAPRLPAIERAVYQDLINTPQLASQCPDAELRLSLSGCTLHALLVFDSQRYLLRGGVRLDLWEHGGREYAGRGTLRAGLIAGHNWTAYAHADFYPGAGETYTMAGAGRIISHRGFIGAGWDFKAEDFRVQADADLAPAAYISADITAGAHNKERSEFALHYRFRDNYELQLVSNLEGEVYAAVAANF